MLNGYRAVVAGAVAMLVNACGGGGSSGTAEDIKGIYQGSFFEVGAGTFDLTGAITADTAAYFVSLGGGRIYAGNIRSADGQVTGSFRAYDVEAGSSFSGIGVATDVSSINGEQQPDGSLTGAFSTAAAGQVGTVVLNVDSQTAGLAAGLDRLQGTWSAQDATSGAAAAITISGNGSFNGSDSDGCQYIGNISPPEQSLNLYKLTVQANCPGLPQISASGLLTRSFVNENEQIVLVASNRDLALAVVLQRN